MGVPGLAPPGWLLDVAPANDNKNPLPEGVVGWRVADPQ